MGVSATIRRVQAVLTMHGATFTKDGQMLTHRQIVDDINWRMQTGVMNDGRPGQITN